jgi:hypothetical protein
MRDNRRGSRILGTQTNDKSETDRIPLVPQLHLLRLQHFGSHTGNVGVIALTLSAAPIVLMP